MKVLIVTQYFWPENFRINDLAYGLVERGHDVVVLTGQPNYPEGEIFPEYRRFRRMREEHQGIRVIRAPIVARGHGGGARLSANFCSFAITASLIALNFRRFAFDVIFVFEPSPITVGIPALLAKRCTGAPILFWVQDLWPESLVATGAVTSERFLKLIGKLVAFIYRRCDRILVASRAFVPSVLRFVPDLGQIHYFPQYGEDLYSKVSLPTDAPERKIVPLGFVVMFAGNIGAAQDFATILAAAEMLREHKEIQFVILGDGRKRREVEEEITHRGLAETFHLLGRHPLESMPAFFSLADVMLVTLRRDPLFALTVPAKIQSYLACARPIIAALDGEGGRIVEEAAAGISCPAESPERLADAVLRMRNLPPEAREKMGGNGFAYYQRNFDRQGLLDKLEGWMRSSGRNRGAPPKKLEQVC